MEPTRAQRVQIFVLTWLTYGSYYLCRRPFDVSKKSFVEQYHFDLYALANINTGYLVAYAAGMFASGLVCDRIGSRRLIGVGTLGIAIGMSFFGMGSTIGVFAVAYAISGLFQSTGWPSVVRAMSSMYAPGERGTVMGLWATCYQVGGIAATSIASWVAARFGWRVSFFAPAAITLAVGVTVYLFLWEPPPAPAVERRAASLKLARDPLVWCLGAAYFCIKLVRYCIVSWLPYFYGVKLHYDVGKAGYLSTSFEWGGVAGAILGGRLFDKTGKQRGWLIVVMTIGLSLSALIYPRVATYGPVAAFGGMVLIGFVLFGPDALVSSVAAQDLGGKDASGSAAGTINGVGSVGAIFQAYITAYVADRYGWDAMFVVFAGLSLFAALAVVPYALVARRER